MIKKPDAFGTRFLFIINYNHINSEGKFVAFLVFNFAKEIQIGPKCSNPKVWKVMPSMSEHLFKSLKGGAE